MATPTQHVDNVYWTQVDPNAPNDGHALAIDLVGPGKRVLELGPAAGHVTRALVAAGCQVVGIEVDDVAAAYLDGVAERVIVGDLSDPSLIADAAADERFDVVLAGDVLEHLPDPLAVLRACRGALVPGGYVVVSLPNVAHADIKLQLLAGRFDYHDFGLLDRTHLRFFTLDSTRALVRDAGFVMLDLRRVIAPVFHTDQAVERETVSAELLERVLADEESETYQFVFRAVPHDGDIEVAGLAARTESLEGDLLRERASRVLAECERDDARAEVDTFRGLFDEAVGHAEGFERLSQSLQAEIAAMKSTRSYRMLAPLRALARRRR